MKKKLFAILLCMVLTVGLLPTTVWADNSSHQHCLCGGNLAGTHSGHDENVSWTGIDTLAGLKDGGRYYLTANVECDETVNVPTGVAICLNGYSIICTQSTTAITVDASKLFILTDCSHDETTNENKGTVTHASGKKGGGVENYGIFYMYGGKISGNNNDNSGGGVYNNPKSTFVMYNGIIGGTSDRDKNTAYNGGGVYNDNANFEMKGGTIAGNIATVTGGGVTNSGGKFTFEGGNISSNKANGTSGNFGYGGGVYNSSCLDLNSVDYSVSYGVFEMKDGVISGNEATHCGGGVYNNSKFTMQSGTISGNKVTTDSDNNCGGGVYNATSKNESFFKLNGGTIGGDRTSDANDAKYGGGISNYGPFMMNGGTIIGNTAVYGGGIYFNSNEVVTEISGGSIEKNTAGNTGGGIFTFSSSLVITDAHVNGNKITNVGTGGGICNNGTLTLDNVEVIGNSCGGDGGGLYVGLNATTVVKGNTKIEKNLSGGNVYLLSGDTITAESLGTDARIRITGTANQKVVKNSTDTSVFGCDSYSYQLAADGSDLKLVDNTETTHTHCICGLDTAEETTHTHDTTQTWVGVNVLEDIMDTDYCYYLTQDVVIKDTWDPLSGMVLCLNGYNIICDESVAVISRNANHKLTLTDCSENETGEITHAYGRTGRGIYNRVGRVDLWRGSVCGNNIENVGAGVYNGASGDVNAIFTMYGGHISNNSVRNYNQGGGVYNIGTFIMLGGAIEDNYSDGSGGGIYNYKGTVEMSGTAAIRNNEADFESSTSSGGGVSNYLGNFVMSGGEISGNRSDIGGGVSTSAATGSSTVTSASFTMTGGAIFGNEARISGGGVINSANKDATSTFTMSGDAVISNNTASNGGGVTNSYGGATLEISGNAAIKDNTAMSNDVNYGYGGGVYQLGEGYGGYPVFNFNGGTISGNSSKFGGGIYVGRGKLNAAGGTVTGNSVTASGGGVYVSGNDTVTLSGSVNVTGNKRSTGDKNNLHLAISDLKVSASGLTDGASIGVTTAAAPTEGSPLTITSDVVAKNYFVSDNSAYKTDIDDDGYAVLRVRTQDDPVPCTVSIVLPDDNTVSRSENSGALEQVVEDGGAITDVILTAADGYYFSSEYVSEVNNIAAAAGIQMSIVENTDSSQVKISGTPKCDVVLNITVTAKENDAPSYRVVEGAGNSWTQNSDGTLTFRADGDISKFSGIKVDGVEISSDKYSVNLSNGAVTLNSDYLAALAVGTHTLTFVYDDGECSASFEVKAEGSHIHNFVWKVDKEATKDETGLKHEECSLCGARRNENTVIDKLSDGGAAPITKDTGDTCNIFLWIAVLFISGGTAVVTAAVGKKKKYSK